MKTGLLLYTIKIGFQHINRGKLLSEVGPESPIALQELLSETEKKRKTWVLGKSQWPPQEKSAFFR